MVITEVVGVNPESKDVFDEKFWDERYSTHKAVWSGNPNPHLVSEATDLSPGRALDVGSGEGADAIWLAQRGWQVTAVDLSGVAIGRAAARAAQEGPGIADRIDWVRANLLEWKPEPASYDLVSAQFMHLPTGPREALFGRLAASVAPGGTLLIVGHDLSDLTTTMPRPHLSDMGFTAADVADSLDSDDWQVLVSEARGHSATDPDGNEVTVHDAVLRARRAILSRD